MAGFRHEHNFRELGGYKDGRTVKKGMFYRSGALAFMDERELAAVGRLGLKSVVDLRSTIEHITFPDPPIDGATNYHYTAMNDNDINEIDYSSRKMVLMAMKEPGLNKMESFGKHLYAHVAFDKYPCSFTVHRARTVQESRLCSFFSCSASTRRRSLMISN